MEISTNNTQTASPYTSTKQKENSSTDSSFDELLNNNSQQDTQTKSPTSSKEDYIEVSSTTEQTQTVTYTQDVAKVQTESYDSNKKFLNFLDKNYPNYFEKNGISKEDEEAIRAVLADNEVSDDDIRELSFEQAQTLHKIALNRVEYGPKDTNNMMILPTENNKVLLTLQTTELTKNDTFNEAIFQTFVENLTLNEHEMFKIIEELSYTLHQAYNGMDLGFNINQAPTPDKSASNQFNNSEFNYDNHLSELLNLLDNLLSKTNIPEVRKDYELLSRNFGEILDNYRELQAEEHN